MVPESAALSSRSVSPSHPTPPGASCLLLGPHSASHSLLTAWPLKKLTVCRPLSAFGWTLHVPAAAGLGAR